MSSRILFLLFLSTCSSKIVQFAGYQLDDMAMCELGWPWNDYSHYGCACSDLIKLAAVDQIDLCCEHHNECYDTARSACGSVSPYFQYYSYKCENNKATCKESIHSCAGYVCNCDKMLIDCLQKYPRPEEGKIPRCRLTSAAIFGHTRYA